MKKNTIKTGKRGNPARVQSVVRHDGDCSIYAYYGHGVCDCGALRKTIRDGRRTGDEALWNEWLRHLSALGRCT